MKGGDNMADKYVSCQINLEAKDKEGVMCLAAIKGCKFSEYVRNLVHADVKKNADKIADYKKKLAELNAE
jgi:hypothetical protein